MISVKINDLKVHFGRGSDSFHLNISFQVRTVTPSVCVPRACLRLSTRQPISRCFSFFFSKEENIFSRYVGIECDGGTFDVLFPPFRSRRGGGGVKTPVWLPLGAASPGPVNGSTDRFNSIVSRFFPFLGQIGLDLPGTTFGEIKFKKNQMM